MATATKPKSKSGIHTAAYTFEAPDWRPPGLEKLVPFWLPDPWNCWMACVHQVTSEMATAWLAINVQNNRNVIDTLVEQVFYDLVKGNWRATHQGIAFNQQNQLFDGQNRLRAIEQAGDKSASLLVFWGVDDGTMQVTDTGRSRSVKASAQIAGKDFSTRHISTMNRVIQHLSYSKHKISRSQLFDLIDEHREALDFVLPLLPSTPFSRADVSAAFTRAYYHIPHEILQRISTVLKSGMPEYEYDQTIVALRDRIIMGGRGVSVGGIAMTPGQQDMDRYFKTLRMITAVVRMEKLEKLQSVQQLDYYQDVYPLPASAAQWKAKGMPRAGRMIFWPSKAGAA